MTKDISVVNDDNTAVLTPEVRLSWLYLSKPDIKFGDPKYQATLTFDPSVPEQAAYVDKLERLNAEAAQRVLQDITKGRSAYQVKQLFTPVEDSDGNLTGEVSLKLTTKKKPTVYDKDDRIMAEDVLATAGNGSKGRARIYFVESAVSSRRTAGLTTYLSRLQITQVVEYAGANGGGFGAVEDTGSRGGARDDDTPPWLSDKDTSAVTDDNSGVDF